MRCCSSVSMWWCINMRAVVTEAGDVEHADVVGGGAGGDAGVDAAHDVVEQAAVHRLRQRVASVARLVRLQRHPASDVRHHENILKGITYKY